MKIKMKIKIIIYSSISIIILLIFSTIFAIINMGNQKTIKGIKIQEKEISDLTQEELKNKIEEWKEELITREIKLRYKENEERINLQEINTKIDIEKAITDIYKIGRQGNIIQNNYEIIYTMIFGKNIEIQIDIDENKLDKKIEEISKKLPGAVEQSNYYIEDTNLIIKKGKEGIEINKEELVKKIKQEIQQNSKQEIIIPIKKVKPKEIDIEEIHQEIYKQVQNAYIKKDPIQVQPHINGVDFAITKEEAKNIIKEEKEEYIIPLKITIPEKTIEELGKEAFPSKLSEFTTMYNINNTNRSINLELASQKINGTVILPNEIFSYNKIVGERTIKEGYKESTEYSGGKIVKGVGGGICQLSSTLYNAVIYANLEIINRANHIFTTSYVEEGRDATVSWGTIDFQFLNTRTYPIKIVSTVKNGVVKVEIYGIEEEKEYEISIQTDIIEVIPNTVNYIEDKQLEKGIEIEEQKGFPGVKSVTYKIKKYNGIFISKEILSNDSYKPLEKIVRRGVSKRK